MENFFFSPETPAPPFGMAQPLEKIDEYSLFFGVSLEHAEEIIVNTKSPDDVALRRNTSDEKRFEDISKLRDWYHDSGRYVFTLVTEDGKIAGLWWARPSALPTVLRYNSEEMEKILQAGAEKMHTSGIRIYPIARSKGLATPFLAECTRYYRMIHPDAYICVDVDPENLPSQRVFTRQGYQLIGYGENKKMVNNLPTERMIYIETPKES